MTTGQVRDEVKVLSERFQIPIELKRECLYTDIGSFYQAVSFLRWLSSTRIDVAVRANAEAQFNVPPHQSLIR